MSETEAGVVVVGAGPAGLAVTACLRRAGVPCTLLERKDHVAPAWRTHYDRLHLHTSRRHSGLPYLPMPSSYPRYPSRSQVVEYLEAYARTLRLEPRLGVEVTEVRPTDRGWRVISSEGVLDGRAVVVATGVNGEANVPRWPGDETFPGPFVHSGRYRNGRPYRGQRVLVVGFGNSGGEIALDLVEHGARPVVSVRGAVHLVPRDLLGLPVLAIAIPLSKLPAGLADTLVRPILRARYPSYRRLGLRRAEGGPFRQIERTGRVPLLDIGTVGAIRAGRIEVRGGVAEFRGSRVEFVDGTNADVDAVILATGYRPSVPPGLGHIAGGDFASQGDAGLFFCGFRVVPTGMFREMGLEARAIARALSRRTAGGSRLG